MLTGLPRGEDNGDWLAILERGSNAVICSHGPFLAEAEAPRCRKFPWPLARPKSSNGHGFMFACLSTGAGCGDPDHIRRLHGSCRMGLISLGEL